MTAGTATMRTIRLPRPLPHQIPVLTDPSRFKVVVCGRRWGKTASGLLMTVQGHGQFPGQRKGALDGGHIWWVAPTYKVAIEIWRDLKRACCDGWASKNEVDKTIEFDSGGRISVRSADNPESLRGAGLDGLVLDEAASIKGDVWTQALRPALSDKRGWSVHIGTPKGFNWLYDEFNEAEHLPGWGRWQRPSKDNPLLSDDELADAKRIMGSWEFSQEYEAQFLTDGLGLFKREWFPPERYVDAIPRGRGVRYWDKAATEGGGDYSAGVLVVEHEGLWYVADVERGQWSARQRDVRMQQSAEADSTTTQRLSVWVEQEPGSGGKESAEASIRLLSGYDVHSERVTGDKETRARPFAAQCEAGNVRIVRGEWNRAFLNELFEFPNGSHDDQVDAAGGAFNKLAKKRSFHIAIR